MQHRTHWGTDYDIELVTSMDSDPAPLFFITPGIKRLRLRREELEEMLLRSELYA